MPYRALQRGLSTAGRLCARAQRLEEARDGCAHLLAGLAAVISPRDEHRSLIDRPEQPMDEATHGLLIDQGRVHGGLHGALHETEAILQADPEPLLPAQ